MKKIALMLISIIFLISCGAKRRATTHHKNKHKPKPVVKTIPKQKKQTARHKVIINNPKVESTISKPLVIDVSENKTTFDKDLLNVLYANKPNLQTAKVDYIKEYAELAIHEMEAYKIPASITLAQGLLESRYGQSVLTKKAKNHFGIKCHKWEGKRVYHDDDEKGECFRKYDLHQSSYRDHSLFLAHKKRYAKLFTFAPDDYKSWAIGLRAAGYATDKKYPQKLILLIEDYELYYFDNLVLGTPYISKEIIKTSDIEEIDNSKKPVMVKKPINIINSKYYTVLTGETLYSISKKTNLSVAALKKYNNLTTNEISVGQELQLFETINKVETETEQQVNYTVKKGDTIYSIAKNYNITIAYLKKINNLSSNNIAIGQKIIVKSNK